MCRYRIVFDETISPYIEEFNFLRDKCENIQNEQIGENEDELLYRPIESAKLEISESMKTLVEVAKVAI